MSRVFSSDTSEVVRARRLVRAHLQAWGCSDEIEAMTLAVSELVTNAVVHGRGPVEVTLTAKDGMLRLAVADHGGGRPTIVQRGTEVTSGGLGLRLVDELADEWGSQRDGARTSVWVERRGSMREGHESHSEPS